MKKILMVLLAAAMLFSLIACGQNSETTTEATSAENAGSVLPGLEDGVLSVAMECANAPYNWSQPDDSNGAVPIKGSALYANGYDVQTAKNICEYLGCELEIVQLEFDSIIPAVQSGTVDCAIAAHSMTEERKEVVSFAGPYIYADVVCLTLKDSEYADAKGLSDLAGASCTSQSGTTWYDSCLPQVKDAEILTPSESSPAMLMALESGVVDFVVTDMPIAMGACLAYPDMVILDFTGTEDNFDVPADQVEIGAVVAKENTALCDAMNEYLGQFDSADFNELMESIIAIQPVTEN